MRDIPPPPDGGKYVNSRKTTQRDMITFVHDAYTRANTARMRNQGSEPSLSTDPLFPGMVHMSWYPTTNATRILRGHIFFSYMSKKRMAESTSKAVPKKKDNSHFWQIAALVVLWVLGTFYMQMQTDFKTSQDLQTAWVVASAILVLLILGIVALRKRNQMKGKCADAGFMPFLHYLTKNNDQLEDGEGKNNIVKMMLGESPASPLTVHALFDRIENSLPEYVSILPAAVVGGIVMISMMVFGWNLSMEEKERCEVMIKDREKKQKDRSETYDRLLETGEIAKDLIADSDPTMALTRDLQEDAVKVAQTVMDYRWLILLIVMVAASLYVGQKTGERVYTAQLLTKCRNRRHFAVTRMLPSYISKFK